MVTNLPWRVTYCWVSNQVKNHTKSTVLSKKFKPDSWGNEGQNAKSNVSSQLKKFTRQIQRPEFVVIKRLWESNVYHNRPVNGKNPEWVVNQWQLQDIEIAHKESDSNSEEEGGKYILFNP